MTRAAATFQAAPPLTSTPIDQRIVGQALRHSRLSFLDALAVDVGSERSPLAAFVAVDAAPLRLVFSGGTALSRAHRLIRRMSEDIDLKILSEEPLTRPALRQLRDVLTKALLDAGFSLRSGKSLSGGPRDRSIFSSRPAMEGVLRPLPQA
jgi:hypothetical protein